MADLIFLSAVDDCDVGAKARSTRRAVSSVRARSSILLNSPSASRKKASVTTVQSKRCADPRFRLSNHSRADASRAET